MPDKPQEILAEIIQLAQALPDNPAEYAVIPTAKRRAMRARLENVMLRLSFVAQSLDSIRQPKHVFDPTNPRVIGEMVAHTLLLQDKESLASVVKQSFYGAGVYALYYHGSFDCYTPISGKEHPIYVGKADPEAMHALTAEAQGTRLHTRLKDHHRSISNVENLNLADFECRYLVVRSAWVETAEDLLIDWFKPVWNNEMKVCYGFGKHGDSAVTRKNERSPWDTLHPGRPWAKSKINTPNRRSVARIRADIATHFKNNPTKI
jgi:hypothetical protein